MLKTKPRIWNELWWLEMGVPWSAPLAATLVKGLLRNNIPDGQELVNSDLKTYFFSAKDYR